MQKDESSAPDCSSVGGAGRRPPLPPVSSSAWLCAGAQHGWYKYVIVDNIVGREGKTGCKGARRVLEEKKVLINPPKLIENGCREGQYLHVAVSCTPYPTSFHGEKKKPKREGQGSDQDYPICNKQVHNIKSASLMQHHLTVYAGANDCKLVMDAPCGGRPAETPQVMFK